MITSRTFYIAIGFYIVFTFILWTSLENIDSFPKYPSNLVDTRQVYVRNESGLRKKIGNADLDRTRHRKIGKQTRCPSLDFPNNPLMDQWQGINNTNTYIYSAFYERHPSAIWIIAARDSTIVTQQLYCHVWGPTGDLRVVKAQLTDLPEGRGRRFMCSLYSCDIGNFSSPNIVSLSTGDCVDSNNAVRILKDYVISADFTVCVTPFNFNYRKAYELVEMIELNRILGASHFVFYNYSINTNVNSVLEHYISLGLVEVLPWKLPMQVDTWPQKNPNIEIHYFGQIAALNDCLYRNRYKTNYIVYQDLDEFIIPRTKKTWMELIDLLPKNSGVFMFRNTFYRKEWPDTSPNFTGKDLAKKFKSATLLKQVREGRIFVHNHRSKYIVVPEKAHYVGIHTVPKLRNGGRYYVDPGLALLHHYRDWEDPKGDISKIEDPEIMKYKDILLNRLNSTWESLSNIPKEI